MSGISFITATPRDLEESLQMMKEFYALDNYPFDPKKAKTNFEEVLSTDHIGKFWFLKIDEVIAGYLILTFGYSFEYGGRDAFIDEFFLKEPYRGKGLGTEVLNKLDSMAQTLGINAIHLEVENTNDAGNRLYLKSGYSGNNRSLLTKKITQ